MFLTEASSVTDICLPLSVVASVVVPLAGAVGVLYKRYTATIDRMEQRLDNLLAGKTDATK